MLSINRENFYQEDQQEPQAREESGLITIPRLDFSKNIYGGNHNKCKKREQVYAGEEEQTGKFGNGSKKPKESFETHQTRGERRFASKQNIQITNS